MAIRPRSDHWSIFRVVFAVVVVGVDVVVAVPVAVAVTVQVREIFPRLVVFCC